MSCTIDPTSNPFLFVPEPIILHILSYCDGDITSKVSLVCKKFWEYEQSEILWKERIIRSLENKIGELFFTTYQGWKLTYINFKQMSQEGIVVSPTEIICKDGTKKTGMFQNGKLNGCGEIIYVDGRKWEGIFKEGKLINGTKFSSDGESAERIEKDPLNKLTHSSFKPTIKEKIGKFDANGDMINGQGKIIYVDGTIKEGTFINGQLEGLGKITNDANNFFIRGPFQKGELNGLGLIYQDGTFIKGEFENDLLHGYATITSIKGEIKGQFKYGRLEGAGEIIYADGTIKKGQFKNGVLQGQGSIIYSDGVIQEGLFQNDRLIMLDRMIYPDGTIKEAEFENDEQYE